MTIIRKHTPLILAILSLALAGYQFALTVSSGAWRNPSNEMVTKWEDHVQALRDALPSGLTEIGYMDDSTISGDISAFDVNEFQLMQYSVAPVALQAGIEHEWVIGNVNNANDLEPWLTEQMGAHEVQSFGFGLYLIRDVENQ